MYKILFVCHGNICRSPMAEFIMKSITNNDENFIIDSKATSYEEIGNPIYPQAQNVLKKYHILFTNHYASRVQKSDYEFYDYIIVMDNNNLYNIERIVGKDINNKIFKLLFFTGSNDDISDPWYTGEFEKCYIEIERGCRALLKYILENKNNKTL